MRWKAQHAILCSAVLGAFGGGMASFVPWPLVASLSAVLSCFCCFFGMLVGYVVGRRQDAIRLLEMERGREAMEAVMREGMGGVGPLVSMSAQAVADRVAVRMASELFRNVGNDEHREAAILSGARIVEEEIAALEASLESSREGLQ